MSAELHMGSSWGGYLDRGLTVFLVTERSADYGVGRGADTQISPGGDADWKGKVYFQLKKSV